MSFILNIPDLSGKLTPILLTPGSSSFFVGANGSGKSRLAAHAENHWGAKCHRISAHRALGLNPSVPKISEQKALIGLRCGHVDAQLGQELQFRDNIRWSRKKETALLNDFDFLLQALFADQSNIALETHNAAHAGTLNKHRSTHFQQLIAIWDKVLPHRTLIVSGDDIQVVAIGLQRYNASEMSDGERAVFYLLGQVLIAEANSVLIFDEPELHIHRAILSRFWDEAEAARADCAFLVITHDLEFAASRPGAKFVIRNYRSPGQWEIEEVPEDSGFSEEIVTLILGSRKPILFVEGTGSSLDLAIYRACYPDWTVLPLGSCQDVIHAVVTMRHNSSLNRITCSGIVDADDYTQEEKNNLDSLGVAALPVSEIENLILLPEVAVAILEEERHQGQELKIKLNALIDEVCQEVSRPGSIDKVVLGYCRRRIDRVLKKIEFNDAKTTEDLTRFYTERTSSLDIIAIAQERKSQIEAAIDRRDLPALLAYFDDKSLFALAAKHLKNTNKSAFQSWFTRVMKDSKSDKLRSVLNKVLPALTPV